MESPAPRTDTALVAACLADVPGSWESFVDRVGPTVQAAVRRALGADAPEADVEDCAAEVMVALVANDRAALRGFRGASKLTTWLYVIARRTTVAWRKRSVRAPTPGAIPDAPDRRPGPGAVAATLESAGQLRAVLAELSERDREVLRRFYLAGESGAAIGAALGIPAKQVSVVLHRARERARKLMP